MWGPFMEWKLFWSAFAVVCVLAASAKNRSAIGWFFLGVLLGPLALLILVCLPKAAQEPFHPDKFHRAGRTWPLGPGLTLPRCKSCGDISCPEASQCRNCGAPLPAGG